MNEILIKKMFCFFMYILYTQKGLGHITLLRRNRPKP